MFTRHTQRPRNVNAWQAASILYGDWGTSKAYVLGLAFVLASYSSFWLILFVGILNILVGINYIIICRCYPEGGGVYAAVKNKSEIIAMVGALFLIGDYIVTASLSAMSAMSYLGFPYPEKLALIAIFAIGIVNYFGPKHTGTLALIIAIPTVICVVILGILSLFYIQPAIQNIEPLKGDFATIWIQFVGVIVALSGIEAIANTTGVMKLNQGSSASQPSVTQTSTKAILFVMIEVSFFTTLFGLAMMALPHLQVQGDEVIASGYGSVRDYMLKYMGETFFGNFFGERLGHLFGIAVSLVFFVLLLSAVNTAIVALVSLIFVISRDGQVPAIFQKLNPYGVPVYALVFSTLLPIVLVMTIHDIVGLADLYAVGFIGAIATNIGATSLDYRIPLGRFERGLMIATFIFMALIEITLIIEKPHARHFGITIVAIGLLLRGIVLEKADKVKKPPRKVPAKSYSISQDQTATPLHDGAILCPVNHIGKTLEFSLDESLKSQQPLYILFIREQQVITEEDRGKSWLEDQKACEIFDYAKDYLHRTPIRFIYAISDSPSDSIIQIAKDLEVSRIILGMPRSNKIFQWIKGNVVLEVNNKLPKHIDLIVIS